MEVIFVPSCSISIRCHCIYLILICIQRKYIQFDEKNVFASLNSVC